MQRRAQRSPSDCCIAQHAWLICCKPCCDQANAETTRQKPRHERTHVDAPDGRWPAELLPIHIVGTSKSTHLACNSCAACNDVDWAADLRTPCTTPHRQDRSTLLTESQSTNNNNRNMANGTHLQAPSTLINDARIAREQNCCNANAQDAQATSKCA